MAKSIQSGYGSDSETGSVISHRTNKLGAILCPLICAVLLVCVFAVSFVGTKMAYEQYGMFCRGGYDVSRLKRYLEKLNITVPVAKTVNATGLVRV